MKRHGVVELAAWDAGDGAQKLVEYTWGWKVITVANIRFIWGAFIQFSWKRRFISYKRRPILMSVYCRILKVSGVLDITSRFMIEFAEAQVLRIPSISILSPPPVSLLTIVWCPYQPSLPSSDWFPCPSMVILVCHETVQLTFPEKKQSTDPHHFLFLLSRSTK